MTNFTAAFKSLEKLNRLSTIAKQVGADLEELKTLECTGFSISFYKPISGNERQDYIRVQVLKEQDPELYEALRESIVFAMTKQLHDQGAEFQKAMEAMSATMKEVTL